MTTGEVERKKEASRGIRGDEREIKQPFSQATGQPFSSVSERSFSAGNVLGRSFSVLFSNFAPFMLMSLIVFSPVILYTVYLVSKMDYGPEVESDVRTWGIVLVVGGLVLNPISTAAVTYGVLQQIRGKHASFGECLRVGIGRMFHVLGVALASSVAIILGIIACIVPGVILSTALFVATPVAILERAKVTNALQRSADLTRDHRMSIFGVLFVIGAINKGGTKILELIFLSGPGGAAPTLEYLKYYMIAAAFFCVVVEALTAVTAAVAYNDLRARKEGLDTDQIASVFD
jgi:hypothetical protein